MSRLIRPIMAALAAWALVLVVTAAGARAQSEGDEKVGASDTATTEVEVEKLSDQEMQEFDERMQAIRERVLKSKASLRQLLDQLRMGSVSLISFSILHTHDVSSTFELEMMTYTLDGYEIYTAVTTEDNELDALKEFPVYEGSLLPGEHLMTVDMVYRGKGYGLFSYLNQYLFKVKSRYVFTVAEGDVVTLRVTSYDQGSFLTSLKDRLKVRFEKE